LSNSSDVAHLPHGSDACRDCGFINPAGFRYCGKCGRALSDGADFTRSQAERRQLTILFCDLVGSTELARRLDPEELRDVIVAFQFGCTSTIRRFGGMVSRYMGDGILALFGYPQAYEDNAERATLAGLQIVETVGKLRVPTGAIDEQALSVRIGIATGLVVVGDLIGEGTAQENAVLGETPNLAARLQTLATPNTILVSASTRALLDPRFEVANPVRISAKGFPDPIEAFQVLKARPSGTWSDIRATRLVGRDSELETLRRLWQQSSRGAGCAALIAGEAGIGKSRIVSEFLEGVATTEHALLRFQCSPHFSNTALHPIVERIGIAADIDPEDSAQRRLAKLIKWLGPTLGMGESAELFAALMGIPLDAPGHAAHLSTQRKKEQTFELLVELANELAARRPLVVIFEDVHWSDPTTREFMDILVSRVPRMSAMLVFTARPDDATKFGPRLDVIKLELRRLDVRETGRLVDVIRGETALGTDVVDAIIERADGIPLYVEELSKVALTGSDSLPATLQDSLMARLDRLGPAKQLAQVASVIGRQFSLDLLLHATGHDAGTVSEGLRALEIAGLVRPLGDGVSGLKFRHALFQEAAYQSLLRSRRRDLHADIARCLEQHFPGTVRDAPELVAHHLSEAGHAEPAILLWLVAGRRASERSQYREAQAHLRNGLGLLSQVANAELRSQRELELLLALGPALITTEGGGTAEVGQLYDRAIHLCEENPVSEERFVAQWGSWRAKMDLREGRQVADQMLTLAGSLGKEDLRLQAHHCQWATLYMLGSLRECCEHIDHGLMLYRTDRDHAHAATFGGHDARICALGEKALARWLLGYPDEATTHAEAALACAEELSHVGSKAHALDYALVLHKFRRDPQKVLQCANDLVTFSSIQRLRDHHAKGSFYRGWARATLGEPNAGLAEMKAAMTAFDEFGTPEDISVYFEMLAETYGAMGDVDAGQQAIEDAFAQSRRCGIMFWNAELHRRRGELYAQGADGSTHALASYRESLACARTQGARMLELRTLTSLLRNLRPRHDCGRETAELQSLLDALDEGNETRDINEARSLLAALQ
jgi:class 3 adenylate cyclase/predicted ATPase